MFSNLENYAGFYGRLAFSVLGFIATGTTALINFNTYFFSSIEGTLCSIRNILKDGRINDAYALLRKYHDSIIINTYSNLYLQDEIERGTFIVETINNWLRGTEELPEYRIMSSYIRASERLSHITELIHTDDRYKRIRDRCNDHMHYNFFANALLNDNEVRFGDRKEILNTFASDLADLFILHIAYLFSLNEYYMTSSDYVDALEMGFQPEPDSQYWVAPFIQEIFDDVVKVRRPDIVAMMKGRTCMHLK